MRIYNKEAESEEADEGAMLEQWDLVKYCIFNNLEPDPTVLKLEAPVQVNTVIVNSWSCLGVHLEVVNDRKRWSDVTAKMADKRRTSETDKWRQ